MYSGFQRNPGEMRGQGRAYVSTLAICPLPVTIAFRGHLPGLSSVTSKTWALSPDQPAPSFPLSSPWLPSGPGGIREEAGLCVPGRIPQGSGNVRARFYLNKRLTGLNQTAWVGTRTVPRSRSLAGGNLSCWTGSDGDFPLDVTAWSGLSLYWFDEKGVSFRHLRTVHL